MKKKEVYYAFSFLIFVSLFMWFYFESHRHITNLHLEKNKVKLVRQNVSKNFNANHYTKLRSGSFNKTPF